MNTRALQFLQTFLILSALAVVSCERNEETVPAAGASPASAQPVTENKPAAKSDSISFGEGFHKDEVTPQGTLRWVRQQAVMTVNAPAAGKYRLTFRPITVFSPIEAVIAVNVNGQASGTIAAQGSDIANAPARSVDLALQAGANEIVLKTDRPEIRLSESDERVAAFGVVLPVAVEALP